MSQTSWLITGASSGLGLALGRYVLSKGTRATLTTRSIEKARELAPDVEEKGGKWLQLDLSDSKLEGVVKEVVEREHVDTIVNNAGYAHLAPVENCSPEAIRNIYETNLVAPIRICQAVTPIFRERKSGTIVNIGSSVSYTAPPAVGVYASTKSALRTVTESLSAELSAFQIRVLLIEPGTFRTNLGANGIFEEMNPAYKNTMVDHVVQNLPKHVAKGDPAKAAERIWEAVTRMGMMSTEGSRTSDGQKRASDLTRIPLGSDSLELSGQTVKAWEEVAALAKEVAVSTDFQE